MRSHGVANTPPGRRIPIVPSSARKPGDRA
jgi:hypothetical protein